MRSSVWLIVTRSAVLRFLSLCGGPRPGDRVALFVRVGRAGGWGRVSLAACVVCVGPGIPCLVGLGDGAVVFGHQG
jgi:hypothetical protein